MDEVTLIEIREQYPDAQFRCADASLFSLNGEPQFDAILVRRPDLLIQPARWNLVFNRMQNWLAPKGMILITTPEQTEASMAIQWLSEAGYSPVQAETLTNDEEHFLVSARQLPTPVEPFVNPLQLPSNVRVWEDNGDQDALICDIRTGQCTPVMNEK